MRFPLHVTTGTIRHQIRNALQGNRRYPFVLMLEPLYTCNLACIGCALERHTGKLADRLPLEACLRAADIAAAPVVSICGGEPTIYPELPQLVSGLIEKRHPGKEKTGRQVTVVSCEPRDSLFQRDELSGDRAGPRKVRAQKLDRSAGALDQAPVHRVPSKRRRLVTGRRAARRRTHTRAASLPGLEPAFLAKGFVRGHHRRPADSEQAREISLRRDATSRLEVAPQDCRAQAVRETPVHRTGGL